MKLKDYILFAGLAAIIGLLIWTRQDRPKVAYVRTIDLLENYKGMNEAAQLYDSKQKQWSQTLDSLNLDYQTSVQAYQAVRQELSTDQRMQHEQQLALSQQQVLRYSQAVEQQAAQEDEQMTQGVLTQVTDFINRYGDEHGYTMILGTTMEGNILYGQDAVDLTEQITEALNEEYLGES